MNQDLEEEKHITFFFLMSSGMTMIFNIYIKKLTTIFLHSKA